MQSDCAPICQTCELLSIEFRCPLDPNASNAWKPGDLNKFFTNITTLPDFSNYEPQVLSKPQDSNVSCSESLECKNGPWVVMLDNFVSDEEADRLIELGSTLGYERSTGTGAVKFDGRNERIFSESRTSSNAWCVDACYDDALVKNVLARIETVTNIPETNSEYLQLLQYNVGQFYLSHHDYIPFHIDRQMGVRILTIFLYLNDVEEGGGTNFPLLNITVTPKKGRAVIWSHVLDDDPHHIDPRTEHQALPVIKGVKYGANAWIHQRDFKVSDSQGCQ
jgi:prolyl 4-hydroxylase